MLSRASVRASMESVAATRCSQWRNAHTAGLGACQVRQNIGMQKGRERNALVVFKSALPMTLPPVHLRSIAVLAPSFRPNDFRLSPHRSHGLE
jgi:hypothetical protein